jgi:transcriptional regulator with XRE-family HTH domain
MILADKIINLRKKNGWSQEELANKMDVSRQAVSKWESAQTVPDLQKILQLAELFGVTTDYLLKDEIETEEFTSDSTENVKTITMEEANEYLTLRRKASWQIAVGTLLCILSPVTLFILGAASEIPSLGVSEELMGIAGLGVLFLFVICAIAIFIYCGFKSDPYSFLENDEFKLAYGVKGLASDRKKKFRNTYVLCNIIATILCVISPVPLIISGFFDNDLLSVLMLVVLFVLVGIATFIFTVVGVQNASMEKLLKEGEYSEKEKTNNTLKGVVGLAYWGIIATIFIVWSYKADAFDISWVVFVIGGVLYPLVMYICDCISENRKRTN